MSLRSGVLVVGAVLAMVSLGIDERADIKGFRNVGSWDSAVLRDVWGKYDELCDDPIILPRPRAKNTKKLP